MSSSLDEITASLAKAGIFDSPPHSRFTKEEKREWVLGLLKDMERESLLARINENWIPGEKCDCGKDELK